MSDLVRCKGCGMSTMIKGGDLEGWKGVEFTDGNMTWYCKNGLCQEQLEIDMEEYLLEQGYTEEEIHDTGPRVEDAGSKRSPLAFLNMNHLLPLSPRWFGGGRKVGEDIGEDD